MDEILTARPEPKTPAEYRMAIDELIAQMWRLHTQMDGNRHVIEQLKAETDVIKKETDLIKARLQTRIDDLLARM